MIQRSFPLGTPGSGREEGIEDNHKVEGVYVRDERDEKKKIGIECRATFTKHQ
jgi:hypothetical protein